MRLSTEQAQSKILDTIGNEYAQFREAKGSRGHSPERLRALVRSAVGMGLSRSQVAKVAGLSPNTVNKWISKDRPRAKELQLIATPSANAKERFAMEGAISIRLCSGIEIEVPAGALNREFLTMLNELGVARC
jgi:transcriptional regulator with XRE-family HTH domain